MRDISSLDDDQGLDESNLLEDEINEFNLKKI